MSNLYTKYPDFDLCIKYRQHYLRYGRGWYFEAKVKSGNTYKLIDLCEMFGLDFITTKQKILEGFTFESVVYGYSCLPPKDKEYLYSIEFENCWYPNIESLVKHKSNNTVLTVKDKLKSGFTLKDALSYDSNIELYGFEYNDRVDTFKGHCEQLCLSPQRITTIMKRQNLSFEQAVKIPVERVIKHCINGVVKRNTDWYQHFNINNPKAINSYLSKNNRTFRDALEHAGVDTSSMEIYQCDGNVVQYNRPI